MDFQTAAKRQYNRQTIYTVYLVTPTGERLLVARTQRKSGTGLLRVLYAESVQAKIVANIPGVADATFQKRADRIEFSCGGGLEFGGTIREEAE